MSTDIASLPRTAGWHANSRQDEEALAATDYEKLDDRELATRAADGQEPAFRELLSRYERPVFSLIYRMVRDRTLAEDLAQEAFIRAFNAIGSYKTSYKFSNWIFKIANNHTIDYGWSSSRTRRIPTSTSSTRSWAARSSGPSAISGRSTGRSFFCGTSRATPTTRSPRSSTFPWAR